MSLSLLFLFAVLTLKNWTILSLRQDCTDNWLLSHDSLTELCCRFATFKSPYLISTVKFFMNTKKYSRTIIFKESFSTNLWRNFFMNKSFHWQSIQPVKKIFKENVQAAANTKWNIVFLKQKKNNVNPRWHYRLTPQGTEVQRSRHVWLSVGTHNETFLCKTVWPLHAHIWRWPRPPWINPIALAD